jgi:hypothetical protein
LKQSHTLFKKKFAKDFDKGYQEFKIGEILKQARIEAGLTQEDVAKKTKY